MPVHLSSPHQLISPASAACPRGTSETIKIKSFNYPCGSTPVAGVKGKFLPVVVFGEVCGVDLPLNQDVSSKAR